MEISRKLYKRLKEEGLDVRDDYSGRCMFGEICFGVVVRNAAVSAMSEVLRKISIAARRDDPDLAKEAADLLDERKLTECRTDNMGLDYIIYFPHITVEKENE